MLFPSKIPYLSIALLLMYIYIFPSNLKLLAVVYYTSPLCVTVICYLMSASLIFVLPMLEAMSIVGGLHYLPPQVLNLRPWSACYSLIRDQL